MEKKRYVGLSTLTARYQIEDLEKGSMIKINFIWRKQQKIIQCEIIDSKILETIPKCADLIDSALHNNKKRLPSIDADQFASTAARNSKNTRHDVSTEQSDDEPNEDPVSPIVVSANNMGDSASDQVQVNNSSISSSLSTDTRLHQEFVILEMNISAKLKEFP